MTEAILRDLARLAAQQLIERPLSGAIDNVLSGLDLFGARKRESSCALAAWFG